MQSKRGGQINTQGVAQRVQIIDGSPHAETQLLRVATRFQADPGMIMLISMRIVISNDIRFSNENCASNYHGKSNDRNVRPPELQWPNSDLLLHQHSSPHDTGQRCTHRYTESAVFHTK
ncbi:hypothetical protein IG631_05170 [Alternaria alternata]|nr:hypothetical protein IG631_05170 [Alternaria alternata]